MITVSGDHLDPPTAVTVSGAPVTYKFTATVGKEVYDTVVLETPPHAAGDVTIAVSTAVGTATATYAYDPVPAPSHLHISPQHGPQVGGTAVTLRGDDLGLPTSVTVDGKAVQFTYMAGTGKGANDAIAFTSPAHAAGDVPIAVTTSAGSASITFTYDPVPAPRVRKITPASVSQVGGTTVTLTGTDLVGASSLTVDGAAIPFTVATTPGPKGGGTVTTIFVAPTHAPGNAAVVVTTPAGSSDPVTLTFEAVPAPRITRLVPAKAVRAGGTQVTITGTDLLGATSLTVDGADVPFTVVSGTDPRSGKAMATITFTAPAHALGDVSVVVTTPAGTSNAAALTYVNGGKA